MTPVRMFLVAGGVALAMAGAAPASAGVIQTSVLWADTGSGAYHACVVTNTGSNPLGSGSKAELVDSNGTVQKSTDLSGQTGSLRGVGDALTNGYEYCRVTVAGSTKNVRANLIVYVQDSTKGYVTLATDDAR